MSEVVILSTARPPLWLLTHAHGRACAARWVALLEIA